MVDTSMTDGNETVTRIPVDEPDYPMAVCTLVILSKIRITK